MGVVDCGRSDLSDFSHSRHCNLLIICNPLIFNYRNCELCLVLSLYKLIAYPSGFQTFRHGAPPPKKLLFGEPPSSFFIPYTLKSRPNINSAVRLGSYPLCSRTVVHYEPFYPFSQVQCHKCYTCN